MPYKDPEKQLAYWRRYAERNREKIREYQKGWIARNREKLTADQRARYKADPEKYRQYFRNHRIKRDYGLSEAQYAALVVQQDGKCGICGRPPSGLWHGDRMLNVDHCHESGAVRGLLCNRCNRALGLVGDTVAAIGAALEYVRRFEESEKATG